MFYLTPEGNRTRFVQTTWFKNPANLCGVPADDTLQGINQHSETDFIERKKKDKKRGAMGKAVVVFQPPSRPFSSLMTGEVNVMVTCIFGSLQDVRMIAASWIDAFTSYFSGVTIWGR